LGNCEELILSFATKIGHDGANLGVNHAVLFELRREMWKGSPMTYLSQTDAALALTRNRGVGSRREERVYQVVTVAAMVTMIASTFVF
jgi:hypothetical protein